MVDERDRKCRCTLLFDWMRLVVSDVEDQRVNFLWALQILFFSTAPGL
jgi:hypothetical protein